MDNSQLLDEIREANLTYLLLAQRMIKDDKAAALFRLGINKEAADLIAALPAEARAGTVEREAYVRQLDGLVYGPDPRQGFFEEGEFIHRCSGSLLSDSVFLTAGHCVERGDGSGEVAAYARIWFEQDAGADYDPVTDTPATDPLEPAAEDVDPVLEPVEPVDVTEDPLEPAPEVEI